MADPVVAQDGHSYERAAIATWFASGRTTSPVTNLPLANCNLAPNHALRVSIEEYQLLLASRAEQAPTSSGRRRSYRKTVAFNPSVV